MRAEDVMTSCVVSVLPEATVYDAAELLIGMHLSALPVVDGRQQVVGIVSEADLMRRAEIGTAPRHSWLSRMFSNDSLSAAEYVKFNSRRVADIMTKGVITVPNDATLGEVAETLAKHKVKRVPVLEGDLLVGIVSRSDLLRALMSREEGAQAVKLSDDVLRRNVIAAVDKQPWSSAWPTNIVVNAGVVHLWGLVASESVSNAYRVAAENVPGVKKVKNHLKRVPASVNMGV